MGQIRARHYTQTRVTGVKLFDTLLDILQQARDRLVAKYSIVTINPALILKEAYVLVEEMSIPHATKYRYKAFLRELARVLGYGNIRVRKRAFHRELKAAQGRTYHVGGYEMQKIYYPQEYPEEREEFSEAEYWSPEEYEENQPSGEEPGYSGDYENLTGYFQWEE